MTKLPLQVCPDNSGLRYAPRFAYALWFVACACTSIHAAQGDIDRTFGTSGFVSRDTSAFSRGSYASFSADRQSIYVVSESPLAIDPNSGGAGCVGYMTGPMDMIEKYDLGGRSVAGFGASGRALIDAVATNGESQRILKMTEASDGSILISRERSASCLAISATMNYFYERRFSNGMIDSNFGTGGRTLLTGQGLTELTHASSEGQFFDANARHFYGKDGLPSALVQSRLQSAAAICGYPTSSQSIGFRGLSPWNRRDQDIFIAIYSSADAPVCLVDFAPDGNLRQGFGNGGILKVDRASCGLAKGAAAGQLTYPDGYIEPRDMARLEDGTLVFNFSTPLAGGAIQRRLSISAADASTAPTDIPRACETVSLDTAGLELSDFARGGPLGGTQTDRFGRLLARVRPSGASYDQARLVRWLANGQRDLAFGTNGMVSLPQTIPAIVNSSFAVRDLAEDSEGQLVLFGNWTANVGQRGYAFVRLTSAAPQVVVTPPPAPAPAAASGSGGGGCGFVRDSQAVRLDPTLLLLALIGLLGARKRRL